MTQSRHKVVNSILRKCANYQEMGRSYTVKVGTKINRLASVSYLPKRYLITKIKMFKRVKKNGNTI